MRALLVALGSHGDVHPFVGLGGVLRGRGHEVTVAANGHFKGLIERAGLGFVEVGEEGRFLEVIQNRDVWHPLRGFRTIFENGILPAMETVYRIVEERYVPGETVVVAHGIAFGARIAREKLGVPLVTVHLAPAVFRSLDEPPKLPGMPMGRRMPTWMKRRVWGAADRWVLDPVVAGPVNAFRKELGLGPVTGVLNEWWHSPDAVVAMFPAWFARPQREWPRNVTCTGFPLYDERGLEPLDPRLVAFLEAGEKPIVFTPGSAMVHGRTFFEASVTACGLLGKRGVLLTRHGEQVPKGLPASMTHVPFAPFSELLPRAAAMVHHGGIGTTSQGLATGCPQLIMAMAHDQFDNADRVKRLGVGEVIAVRKYRGPAVARKLAKLLGAEGLGQRCAAVRERIAGEWGLERAGDVVEGLGVSSSN